MTYNSNAGYKDVIDTLTGFDRKITDQKFYVVNIPEYVDIDEGKEPYRESVYRRNVYDVAGDGYDGFTDSGSNNLKTTRVGIEVEGEASKRHIWKKSIEWNFTDLEKIKVTGDYDLPENLMRARKRNFDLLLQDIAFNGNAVDNKINGLLDIDGVTVDATLLTKQIADMNPSELQNFASRLLDVYFQNSNSTQMPNRFVIPSSDFNRLGAFSDPNFAIKSKLDYLLEAFNVILSGYNINDFKILPLSYANKEIIETEKDTYILYNKDPNSLVLDLPIGYKTVASYTPDYMNFKSEAYAQIGGVVAKRKLEILRFIINN